MPKRILIYYHPNKKSVSLESQIAILKKKGFQIVVLTIDKKGILHEQLDSLQIENFSSPFRFQNSILNYLFSSLYLIYFTYRHGIDFIMAHLHVPCFTTGIAQFFIRSKCIFFRHNSSMWNNEDLFESDINSNERKMDRWINSLAKRIVVPSQGVKDYMIKNEHIGEDKIQILHYIYDFNLYPSPNEDSVFEIKTKYKSNLLLIMVSRMVKHKRHQIVFETIKELISKGLDIKALILDGGPEKKKLEEYVINNALQDHIFFIGFVDNPIDFMKAADVLIQPSMTDASNSVAKEMGLLSKLIMVSDGVGDYSEYIIHKQNGILLPIVDTKNILIKEIEKTYNNEYNRDKMGEALKHTILNTFSREILEKEYIKFLDKNLI